MKQIMMGLGLAIALFIGACSLNPETGRQEFDKQRAALFAHAALAIWAHVDPEGAKAKRCYDSTVALRDSLQGSDETAQVANLVLFLTDCEPYMEQIQERM